MRISTEGCGDFPLHRAVFDIERSGDERWLGTLFLSMPDWSRC
ncbi:MAG: hypothetical protein Q8902_15915 [Bacteroidota bacterium]|nr:hypothetical protein [Bacteroidota bacterium]